MPIYSGDVKMLASAVMADVPEGGGAPTGHVIPDGISNTIFPDISELDRAGGRFNLRKVFVGVHTDDTDTYSGANVIVAETPKDPRVSVALFRTDNTFDTRKDAQTNVENYLIQSSEWGGFLFENHVAGQRSIQLFQRPGTAPPTIGRTLVLIQNEGLSTEVVQYVRTTKVETATRTFTETAGTSYNDYQALVVTCEISDVLRTNFAGSPASRAFTKSVGKTVVRDTTVADAAVFYGATTLIASGVLGDSVLRVSSVYTQLVPAARTEAIALDQKPAAQRSLVLATTPRKIEVTASPHTMRIRVGQENRGYAWTQMLKPRPAPGTIVINYMALGNWYSVYDDGVGALTGDGVGTVNYTTGSIALTLPSMPDSGTSILFSWGENTAYTDHSGQAGFRAPEFAWATPQAPLKPGAQVVTWYSGGVLKTATDNGSGHFTGDAAGEIIYATGKIFLRPTAMIDAGGEFVTDFTYSPQVTKQVTGLVPDAGGFVAIPLDDAPAPHSVNLRWVTVRNVSESSGSTELVSTSDTTASGSGVGYGADSDYVIEVSGGYGTDKFKFGSSISLRVKAKDTALYSWSIEHAFTVNANAPVLPTAVLADSAPSGPIYLAANTPTLVPLTFVSYANAQHQGGVTFNFVLRGPTGDVVASTPWATVDIAGLDTSVTVPPRVPPDPCIFTRQPTPTTGYGITDGKPGLFATGGMMLAGGDGAGKRVYVTSTPVYDPVFGYRYDAPATADAVFSAADLAAGKKTLKSAAGVDTEYTIFGA